MSRVIVSSFGLSIDGFGAGPNQASTIRSVSVARH